MKTLIKVILRYHFFLLFILLEGIALSLVISSDVEKKNAFFSSANVVSGFLNKRFNNVISYFSLSAENETLIKENFALRKQVVHLKKISNEQNKFVIDTTSSDRYEYLKARVIKNSVTKNRNFITLDKGEYDGVEKILQL